MDTGIVSDDSDADTDSDTDTDTDTDTDSDTDVQPSVGAVYVGSTSSGHAVRAFAADASLDFGHDGSDVLTGPISRHPDSNIEGVIVASGEAVYGYSESGLARLATLTGEEVVDLYQDPSRALLIAATATALYDVSGGNVRQLGSSGQFRELASVFAAGPDLVYILDRGGTTNSPSLYAFDPDTEAVSIAFPGYDTTRNRSVDAFLGPEDRPFVCSRGGGAYAVEDVRDGVTTPERLATGSLTDIVDCGYDPATDEVVLFSTSAGVVRVQSTGATTVWIDASEVRDLLRGKVY
ncbi:MAG: hypothetical protein H6741_15130 [Alphaproteobacteria bacterium]|nr:hypothetical protein [Alphaproteobacteria bacterium]